MTAAAHSCGPGFRVGHLIDPPDTTAVGVQIGERSARVMRPDHGHDWKRRVLAPDVGCRGQKPRGGMLHEKGAPLHRCELCPALYDRLAVSGDLERPRAQQGVERAWL